MSHEPPEYSVGCTYPNGRTAGRCFDIFSEADSYFDECVASGRYSNVALFDVVDNLLDEWMADEVGCEVCDGDGWVPDHSGNFPGRPGVIAGPFIEKMECPACNGTGRNGGGA